MLGGRNLLQAVFANGYSQADIIGLTSILGQDSDCETKVAQRQRPGKQADTPHLDERDVFCDGQIQSRKGGTGSVCTLSDNCLEAGAGLENRSSH